MNSDDYQNLASRTLTNEPGVIENSDLMHIWNALGLAGESGELANKIKKAIFHKHGFKGKLDLTTIKEELGDCMWYIAALCTGFGFNLSDVMEENINKLKIRYPEGWSTTRSLNRKEG